MSVAKVAISLDESLLQKIDRFVREEFFPSRSKVIQEAIEEKIEKLDRNRLRRECAKMDPISEQNFADEGMAAEVDQWPKY